MIRMEGMVRGGGGGGGGEEEKHELHLPICVPSSENSLLNIICKVLYTFTNTFTTKIRKLNSPK